MNLNSAPMDPVYSSSSVRAAFTIQCRVVGALVIRELHTRFGRHNIGFVWMIAEPATLAIGVTLAHVFGFVEPMPYGVDTSSFWVVSYTPWCMFRSIVLRSSAAIEANKTLLYHRIVTVLDIQLARALLDGLSVTFCLFVLLFALYVLGVSSLPQRLGLMLIGMGLLWWLAFGFSLIYVAWSERSHLAERFVEPGMYLILPISGVFINLSYLPYTLKKITLWVPMSDIVECIRQGQFENMNDPDISITYALIWCIGLTLLGLLAIRSIRSRIEL